MLKPKQYYIWFILIALASVPIWANAWIAHEYRGSLSAYRWSDFFLTSWDAIRGRGSELFRKSAQVGLVGAVALGALIFYFFEGIIFGVTVTDSHGSARWGTKAEAEANGLVSSWGVVLGKFGLPKTNGKFLRVNIEKLSNMLVSAPPGSGKSAGIVIPTLMEYPGSPLIYDIKAEIFEATARARKNMGDEVRVFAPFDMNLPGTPKSEFNLNGTSHSFNPLEAIAAIPDIEDRLTRIQSLAVAFLSPKSQHDAHLLDDGRRIFVATTAIVCADRNIHPTFAEVAHLLTPDMAEDGETPDYKATFQALAMRAPDPISYSILMKAAGQDNKSLGIYMAVLQGAGLQAWENPAIIRATRTNDFDFSTLGRVPQSNYICIPPKFKDVAAPVVRLMMQWAVIALQDNPISRGDDFLPTLFMIDEFHSLGRMQSIVDASTVLRGYGGRLCLIVQTPSSIAAIYGADAADVLMDTVQLKVWMAPNSDKTKKELSATLGTTTISKRNVSSKLWGDKSDRNDSYSEASRPLKTPDELGSMSDAKLIITSQNNHPLEVDKVRWFEDKHYIDLALKQKDTGWPIVPQVKDRTITTFSEFLRPVGSKVESTAENEDQIVAVKEPEVLVVDAPTEPRKSDTGTNWLDTKVNIMLRETKPDPIADAEMFVAVKALRSENLKPRIDAIVKAVDPEDEGLDHANVKLMADRLGEMIEAGI